MKSGFNILCALFFLFIPLSAQDVTFSASVDRTSVGADEQFALEFVLSGAGMGGGKNLKLPDLGKFMIISGPSQSSNVQIVNGSVSSSVTYSYVLQPREVGKFTIGAASIETGGKQYSSRPMEITVVKGAAKPKQPAAGGADADAQVGDNLFLRAVVDRSRVYVGEQIIVTFKVYTRVSITNYSINKLPAMTGFWGEELAVPQQVNLSGEVINGKQYKVGVLKKMALFPTQAGTLEVNPLEIACQVQVQNRKRSNDWFNEFFNDPVFSNLATSNVGVKSPPLKITVIPLPKNGVPHSFKGAVGKFSLNATLSSRTVRTNEPISLRATIGGSGNIKILEAPNVEIPNDFEKYDPKVNETIDRSTNVVNGSKTFEWLLVPRYPGQKRIPPMEFSYFEPSKAKYITLRSTALDLTVEKGSAEAPQIVAGISKEDVKLLSQDIRFIKTTGGSFHKKGGEPVPTAALVLMTLLPLLAFVGLAAYRQKTMKELSDIASFRSRKAMKITTKRLKEAKVLLKSNNAEAFYAETSRALWAYVSDKLAIDRSELSIDGVMQQLAAKSISTELIARLKECLEACEFARFAPSSAAQEEKSKMYSMASDVIIATERELNK
jgi:hypothetical protein